MGGDARLTDRVRVGPALKTVRVLTNRYNDRNLVGCAVSISPMEKAAYRDVRMKLAAAEGGPVDVARGKLEVPVYVLIG